MFTYSVRVPMFLSKGYPFYQGSLNASPSRQCSKGDSNARCQNTQIRKGWSHPGKLMKQAHCIFQSFMHSVKHSLTKTQRTKWTLNTNKLRNFLKTVCNLENDPDTKINKVLHDIKENAYGVLRSCSTKVEQYW